MASPVPIHVAENEEPLPAQAAPVYFLAVPEVSYKALSDAAASRNLSIAQLLSAAVSDYLKKSEGA